VVENVNQRRGAYDSGVSDYRWGIGGGEETDSTGDTKIVINYNSTNSIGSGAGEGCDFVAYIKRPDQTVNTAIHGNTGWYKNDDELESQVFYGKRQSAADVDGIQFLFSSGNVASGEFTLYGVRNA